jgi:hypothetical protein
MVLVESYLKVHFSGVPAAVFFDPLGDGTRVARVADLAGEKDPTLIIHAGIYILPRPAGEALLQVLCGFVNNLSEGEYGYVAAWDGYEFITENT